ncbi:hypothetical protein EUGRSUZ_E01506 [Eucalyptus grandis]|uniref:Uncharacterized protein n=2 Tax=Eucalyptus grandis TaxID=71139 RepID=A0ACC3KUF2_EUCGR|nr:hypothetical protein EUGRSUZ_E01506 [Eucalyptus grandis]
MLKKFSLYFLHTSASSDGAAKRTGRIQVANWLKAVFDHRLETNCSILCRSKLVCLRVGRRDGRPLLWKGERAASSWRCSHGKNHARI